MHRNRKILNFLRKNLFLSDSGKNFNKLVNFTKIALSNLIDKQGDGPLFPTYKTSKFSEITKESQVPENFNFNPETLLKDLYLNMQGSVKANSPFMVKNIIPQANFIYLSTFISTALYMGNAVTGEDAGESVEAEIACASAISKLAGYDSEVSGGVFTFGGTATNFYGIKIGMMKSVPEHAMQGIVQNNVVVVGSRSSHYCHQTASNWLGFGQDNYIQINPNTDQTTNLIELEKTCEKLIENGKKIACIEAVGGTTSNMAIDDIEEIANIRDRLVSKHNLSYKPHLHVDSVIGWVYLNFVNYNFNTNPLGFSKKVLEKLDSLANKISKLKYADSFGVDFHKTGYMPYVSSMFIVKNKDDFNLLKRKGDIMTPLFHDDKAYNPGVFTIETSRSSANIVAAWTTLKTVGQEGYRVLLGHSLEMSEEIKKSYNKLNDAGLLIVNTTSYGCDIFLRCYPPNLNPIKEHKEELKNDDKLKELTKYTNDFFRWFTKTYNGGIQKIALSKSSAAFYNLNGTPVVALRIYLLNLNNTKQTIKTLVEYIINAKKEFDKI